MNELKIYEAPTRKDLTALFKALNLNVTTQKILDCLIYCRGRDMDNGKPELYSIEKLINWFMMNIRTINHISLNKEKIADQEWLEDKKRNEKTQHLRSIPLPWKPHPKAFIRRGTGTGGSHVNRILRNRDRYTLETSSGVFPEYGLNSRNMARSYDAQSRKHQNRLDNMNRYK